MGFKVQSFKLFPLGFIVSFKIDTENFNKKILKANLLVIKKIIVALAGPSTNLILIIFFIMLDKEEIFMIPTELILYSNFLILIFNTLPIYPLDGGRIIKNLSHIFFGKTKSLELTRLISNLSAMVLSLFIIVFTFISKNISYLLVLIYIWIMIFRENRIFRIKIKMYKILENYLALNDD